ncbi:MAG: hypothetical protein JXR94_22370 [Candidatus Hydrogenedentes bacterium]|nr:hypothetical protein [Candidatus Hydrogenedentota bacterium]
MRKIQAGAENRGAALIIAVALLAILMVIALTFYTNSRLEMSQATNRANAQRAELASNAGIAMAMAFLRHDALVHSAATSLDHAWKSYFNAAWYAGKDWAAPTLPNYPEIDMEVLIAAGITGADGDQLYIPRFQTVAEVYDDANPPGATEGFIVDPDYTAGQTEAWAVDIFADVDSDGDGYKDAAWLPVPMERLFDDDRLDNDLDGLVDEGPAWADDGIDNDGDGDVDEADERGLAPEQALFVYWGGNDALDNDGDGDVDEADEQREFLTAPLTYLWDDDDDPTTPDVRAALPAFDILRGDGTTVTLNPAPGSADVDRLDNDYSQIINDGASYFYDRAAETDEDIELKYNEINMAVYFPAFSIPVTPAITNLVFTATGEPVCELAGRVAVYIRDESDKANLNAAGGLTWRDDWFLDPQSAHPSLMRAIASGATGFEYDLRTVDGDTVGLGEVLAPRLWGLRMGGPDGLGCATDAGFDMSDAAFNALEFDLALPGYGLVDDNGNALALTLDGVDNDGDGLIDEGLNPAYPDLIGHTLEGIDEPAEFQLHRPFRNLLAEGNAIDDDGDDATDEIGELGDRLYRDRDQMALAYGIGTGYVEQLARFLSVHSAERNERLRYYQDNVRLPYPEAAGPKLDYNYALGDQVAAVLTDEWYYPATRVTNTTADVAAFALGLRQADTRVDGWILEEPTGGNRLPGMAQDAQLHALQLGANLQDFRDPDDARTDLTNAIFDDWWALMTGGASQRSISYTVSGAESIRITEIMVRPVRRIEAEMENSPFAAPQFSPNHLSAYDDGLGGTLYDFFIERETGAGSNWQLDSGSANYIGDGAYLSTTYTKLGDIPPLDPAYATTPWDAVQFVFHASPGLPPGTYFLTVNTTDEDGTPSVGAANQLRFAVKYITKNPQALPSAWTATSGKDVDASGNDILDDDAAYFAGSSPDEVPWRPVTHFSTRPPGWAFLDTGTTPVTGYSPRGYAQDFAHTVEIPPYGDGDTDGDGIADGEDVYLCVALRRDEAYSGKISINFFDFSQEPDHEWIEIENIAVSGDPVDLSGWEVTVGTSGNADFVGMTIPDNTYIAPGGTLLLGTNKFDNFDDGLLLQDFIFRNGIGLARGPILMDSGDCYFYDRVSVPPIPDLYLAGLVGYSLGESVFRRDDYTDFVDRDGDGYADTDGRPDDGLISTNDPIGDDNKPAKAWDRIVQLVISDLDLVGNAPDALAELVLNGGIFPNYPEHDDIDNDDDNDALMTDHVDNDGDGTVDEAGEGKDEGNPDSWAGTSSPAPGSFSFYSLILTYGIDTDNDGTLDVIETLDPSNAGDNVPYLGTYRDMPAWKEFVERRMFPGDCVVVTLWQGPRLLGRVADRITYTERDVINRAVDDVLGCPYYETSLGDPCLDPRYLTMWPDNTMAVDFYRSLERKHPLYTGDRFGHTNRWEATDGAYDHWDPGTNRFDEYAGANRVSGGPVLYGHGFSGSPLRKNFFTRVTENAFGQFGAGFTGSFTAGSQRPPWEYYYPEVRNRGLATPGDLVSMPQFAMIQQLYSPAYVGAAVPLVHEAVTDIMLADSAEDTKALGGAGTLNPLVLTAGQADFYPLYPDLEAVVATPASIHWDIDANVPPQGWAPVFLYSLDAEEAPHTVIRRIDLADSTAYPFFPYLQEDNYPVELNFLFQTPAWPSPPWPATMADDLRRRWPIQSRAVMYVSANPVNFVQANTAGHAPTYPDPGSAIEPFLASEALFVWDGADGLENGEYDVYIVTAEPLDALRDADYVSGQALLSDDNGDGDNLFDFGHSLLDSSSNVFLDELAVDVACFTDPDGDHKCWAANEVRPPNATYLDAESFGLHEGAVPSTQGIIHYGTVKVENTYLALFLRNWGLPGRLNRFSRVVLTPCNRTPGRININTAVTRQVNADVAAVFNPLWGVPGALIAWQGLMNYYYDEDLQPDLQLRSTFEGDPIAVAAGDPPDDVARRIVNDGRRVAHEHYDGRYYENIFDVLFTEADEDGRPLLSVTDPDPADDELYFVENAKRFMAMSNQITTRSDIFEIIVTAQAGIGVDANGDGIINWRDDDEFDVLGEKKSRLVYER